MCRLRDLGFQVAAAGPVESEEFARFGIPFHRYSLTRSVSPWGDAQTVRELTHLFGRHRPDLVHAVNTKPSLLVPHAARRAGVSSCVRTITGMGAIFSSNSPLALALRPLYHVLQRSADRLSGHTIFQNPDDREYFLSHRLVTAERESLVRGSGIDVDAFRSSVSDASTLAGLRSELGVAGRPVITMVARLLKPKGVEQFLLAASRVRQKLPGAAFVLVGPAVDGGPTVIPVEEVLASRDVIYLGHREDISDLLAISDLFVLPSFLREGLPRVLLEAGALGLPLVTTDMPGCREVVHHGANGLLVPPRDAGALAESILELLSSPTRRVAMGACSRELVESSFHLRIVADAYARVYQQCLFEAPGWPAAENQAA